MLPVSRHKCQRIGETDLLTQADVAGLHSLLVFPGNDPQEGNAVAVLGIHIRLNLEHEPGKPGFRRLDPADIGLPRLRRRRPLDQAVQHVVDPEVTKRGPEKHRSQPASQERIPVKLMRGPLDQLYLIAQIRRIAAQHS